MEPARHTRGPNVSAANDTAEWAKTHQASFEAEPIIEMRGSEKIQAGFMLSLYARLPMEIPPGEERKTAAAALWERLRAILTQALDGQGGDVQVDIEPLRTAAALRPSNKMQPEITLRAHIRHKEAFQAVSADERQRMSAFEKKISAMGLRAGHW